MRTRAAARRLRFGDALGAYTRALAGRCLAPTWLTQIRTVLLGLERAMGRARVRDLRRLGEAQLFAYARGLAPLSLRSRHTYLGIVKAFFAFLAQESLLLRDPAHALTLPAYERLPRALVSQKQARRLMDAPHASSAAGLRDRAVLELLYGSGLRVGECERLDLTDLELGEGTLLVRDGKGHKDRRVPLTARAVHALERYLEDGRPRLMRPRSLSALFLARGGQRLSRQSLRLRVRKYGREIGTGFTLFPHLLRHACATHLLSNGADVRHVQALLGHRRLATTVLYTRVAVRDLARMLERSHPRARRARLARKR